MRNRTTILILLACAFAVIPAMESNRQAAVCAERYGTGSDEFLPFSFESDGSCPVQRSRTPLELLLMVLTAGCGGAALISAGKVWRDRRKDSALFQSASFAWSRQPYRGRMLITR